MPLFVKARSFLRNLFLSRHVESDLDQEVHSHLEMLTEENIRGGMSPQEAQRAARIELGGIEQVKEQVRDERIGNWLQSVLSDCRYGLRQLRKNPGFTVVAVLTLALGIGANTAIFSLINAVMLRRLPVHEPQQLLILKWTALREPNTSASYFWSGCPDISNDPDKHSPGGCTFSYPMFDQIRSRRDIFAGVSGFTGPVETHVTVNGHVSMARGNLVSGNFFSTLGVRAFAGRSLGPMDDLSGAPPAVMLSYGYWQNRFGGDPSIVGKSILLEHSLFLVAGVVGPGFSGVDPGLPTDIWAPLSSQDVLAPYVPKRTAAKSLWVEIIARLKPGVPIAQAQSALDVIFVSNVLSGVGTVFKTGDSPRIELLSVARGLTSLRAQFSLPLFVLMAAVGIVLLIASANIGGLSLARAMAREQEMAVRLSLGATRARIVRQLLTESLLLAMLGTVLGILIAYWSASSLAAFLAANWYMPLELDVRPDGIVLGFTIAVALLTTLLFGLAPAVQSLRVDLAPAIKRGGKTLPGARGLGVWRFGFGSGLVVAQVGLSIIVLAGAGLLVHTLVNLETLDVGFDTHHVLLFRADSSLTDYKADRARILYRELQDRLAALPGVTSASYSMVALLSGAGIDTEFALPATPDEKLSSDVLPVGQHFFETMHVPLLAGRTFVAADLEARAKPEPVVVNEALAKALFGKESPLGRQFIEPGIDTLRVIVGVVRDARYTSMRREPAPTAYVPLHQDGGAEFELRTAGDPRAIASAVRAAVNEVAPNILISDLETQTDQIEHALYQERLFASLSALFSALALLLACIGIYGLLSYEVTRRTHEIGVRMALGAAPRDVLRLVFRRGLLLVTMGTVMGVAAAVGLTRYLQSLLYGIRAVDPFTYACAVILLAVVALAACWIPARRAMRVDPMVALRYE